jgi:hypothetical protein
MKMKKEERDCKMNDKESLQDIHMEIHAVRRLKSYQPSIMEKNISKIIIERFAGDCKECKTVQTAQKEHPETNNKSFFSKLGEAME